MSFFKSVNLLDLLSTAINTTSATSPLSPSPSAPVLSPVIQSALTPSFSKGNINLFVRSNPNGTEIRTEKAKKRRNDVDAAAK